jgi:tetratricopeptide (TPR) repeat protein
MRLVHVVVSRFGFRKPASNPDRWALLDQLLAVAARLKELGRPEEALAEYQLALWIQPARTAAASAHWNRSLVWLQEGTTRRAGRSTNGGGSGQREAADV